MKRKLNLFLERLKKFHITTSTCKICFNEIKNDTFTAFLHKKTLICKKCRDEFEPKFYRFKVLKYNAISIYKYDEKIQNILYQIKGCYDIEITSIFLEDYYNFLSCLFFNFYMVPIPSFKEDDERREFNHVIEIFKPLKLKMLDVIEKISPFKQAEHNSSDRSEIAEHLIIKNGDLITNKNILIVDDVLTTGSTIKSVINLLLKYKPKSIKILVIARSHPELGLDVK